MHHFPRPTQSGAILLCGLAVAWVASVAAPQEEPSREPTVQPTLPTDIEIDFVGQSKRTEDGHLLFTGPVTITWRDSRI